jgi:uncharacterized membrane protein YidH (DUF202 family)
MQPKPKDKIHQTMTIKNQVHQPKRIKIGLMIYITTMATTKVLYSKRMRITLNMKRDLIIRASHFTDSQGK